MKNKHITIRDWLEYLDDPDIQSLLAGDIKEVDSIEDFIKIGKEMGLTHLVTDGKSAQPNVLNDIFYNEKKLSVSFKAV